MALRLPEAMLAKTGDIPLTSGWLFEPKLDGFRAMVCTHGKLTVRSRRGWNMTPLLPELAGLPDGLQLDGEIVALDGSGLPDFHLLSSRLLHKRAGIPVMLFVFDVLACEGKTTIHLPYGERRNLLEALELNGPSWQTVATFEDGVALFDAVCARGLEGVVAKRLRDPYRPAERVWVKTKNRATARFAEERARATKGSRAFV